MKNKLTQQENGVIGGNTGELLAALDRHIPDEKFRQELKHSLQQLAELKIALDESSIVAVTDSKGRIQYVNDKFCEVSKYDRSELIGKDHRIINSGYHDKAFMKNLWETISTGNIWRGEIRNRAKDGGYYWVNTTIVPLIGEDGKPMQYLAVRSEVTQLKEAEAELQQLMVRMMDIQEDERKRFSRELHDGIGQSLYSLVIQLDRILSDPPEQTPVDAIGAIRGSVTSLIEDVRGLAWELRPSVLDDLGVVPALRTYLELYASHFGIRVAFENTLRRRLGIEKETVIYRIIQESLTNVAKYAGVDGAKLSVEDLGDRVRVRIADKGAGFVRDSTVRGVGLFGMEERARAAGGRLEVESTPGEGTTVTLDLPVG